MIAESTAASGFPRESAMTANVAPEIPQIPAARPSRPSRKLTMFMIATIQTSVTATLAQNGSSWMPMNGNVKRSMRTPKSIAIAAAPAWPPSFTHHGRPRKSSAMPTVVASAAPSRIPR